jgi:hypothetical protein
MLKAACQHIDACRKKEDIEDAYRQQITELAAKLQARLSIAGTIVIRHVFSYTTIIVL